MTANTAQDPSSVSSAQIIKFPGAFKSNDGFDEAVDVVGNVLEMKVAAAEEALAFIMDTFLRDMTNAGFKLHDDRLVQLLIAQTRAIMYDHLGLEHPIHKFVDNHIDEIDNILIKQLDLLEIEDLMDD